MGIGYVGKLDDFTLKPLQQESLLLTGVGQHPSFQLSLSSTTTLPLHAKAHTPSHNAAQTRLRHGRAGRAITSRESTARTSDDDSSSDSDRDASSNNDECRGEDEQHRPSGRKNIPWDEIEEQRLRVYKEEGKAWNWIFKKFPTRTEPAIRTRWTMIQRRVEYGRLYLCPKQLFPKYLFWMVGSHEYRFAGALRILPFSIIFVPPADSFLYRRDCFPT
jgi:hypothetical protein